MQTHLMRRAPDIARHFVGIWNDHEQALTDAALPYLDQLMDAAVAAEPMTLFDLKRQLVRMVPGMHWGTARRLVDMKYRHLDDEDLITPGGH